MPAVLKKVLSIDTKNKFGMKVKVKVKVKRTKL